jgi:hypothetical protein
MRSRAGFQADRDDSHVNEVTAVNKWLYVRISSPEEGGGRPVFTHLFVEAETDLDAYDVGHRRMPGQVYNDYVVPLQPDYGTDFRPTRYRKRVTIAERTQVWVEVGPTTDIPSILDEVWRIVKGAPDVEILDPTPIRMLP